MTTKNTSLIIAAASATPGCAREAALRNTARRAVAAEVASAATVREAVTDRQALPERPLTMLEALAAAKARKGGAATRTAAELRKQLEDAVGSKSHSIPRLEAMRQEAREAMEGEELAVYEAQLDSLVQVRKDLEKAEAEVKRLAAVSTPEGVDAHLDRKIEDEAKTKAAELKAKAQARAKAEDKAKEERIGRILADLGDLTPGQRVSIGAFLATAKWDYIPNAKGRAALMGAAARVAADRAKEAKALRAAAAEEAALAAQAREAARAARAPLSHNMSIKK